MSQNNNKNIIIIIIIILFCLLVGSISFLLFCKQNKEENMIMNAKYPESELLNMQGEKVKLCERDYNHPMFMLYFNSGCEYCESIIDDLLKNSKKFNNIQLIFISFEDKNDIKSYFKYHDLHKFKYCEVYSDVRMDLAKELNITAPPTYFIFDNNNNLIKSSKGVINANGILNIIKKSNQ